jgi:hypothetical protein
LDKDEEPDDASDEDTEKSHPDLQAVRSFITDLDEEITRCLNAKEEPETKLRNAAAVKVSIPVCKPETRTALQDVLNGVGKTVQRVFDEADTLVVPKSQAELEAEEEFEYVSSRSALYTRKMEDHRNKGMKAKTAIGKEYERSRFRHYKEKDAALTPFDDEFLVANAKPSEERTKQIKDAIQNLLGDLSTKMKRACDVVGGKKALQLREGVDGGIESMNMIIQAYTTGLNEEE